MIQLERSTTIVEQPLIHFGREVCGDLAAGLRREWLVTNGLGGALLEKRTWMAYGENTTYIAYRVLRGTGAIDLEISPLVTYRDFHALTSGRDWRPQIEIAPHGALIQAFEEARPFWLLADRG